MLAFLWALLSCQPGHALEGGLGQPHAHSHPHAVGASASPETPRLSLEASVSALANGCDGDALATAFRRDGHNTPDLSVLPASAADVLADLRARVVRHRDPSAPSFHSLKLARPLRI